MTSKPEDVSALPAVVEAPEAGYALSQRAAEQCRQIVEATAVEIERRKYVSVEGWQAIAIAHGCAASARDVEAVYDPDGGLQGYRAVGEVRRMLDGVVVATGEGFVGVDEATWFGGKVTKWGKTKTYDKRPDYAIRAMAQTRAISRACRSAFAHVVVIINKDLGTTPAEEMIGLQQDQDIVEGHARAVAAGHGETVKGHYRKKGVEPTKEELEARRLQQYENACKWINEQLPTLSLMTPEGIKQWEESDEIAPRIRSLENGRDGEPGYEHLKLAWDHYQQSLDNLRKPPA